MRHFVLRILLGIVMFAALQSQVAAQIEDLVIVDPAPQTVTRIKIGGAIGTPGLAITLPIYFTPEDNVAVGRLKLNVDFVSVNLKFSKLQPGIAAQMGNVALHNEIKIGENEKGVETTSLEITTSFLDKTPPPKGIPSGLLGYLTMRIDEDARPAKITLRTAVEAAALGSDELLESVEGIDALVEVFAPGTQPMITCFFFTH